MSSAADPLPRPSRRQVVLFGAGGATAAALALSGCTSSGSGSDDDSDRPEPPKPDPDRALLTGVRDAVTTLVARYAATEQAHPALADRIGPLRGHQERHLATLEKAVESAARGPLAPDALKPAPPKPSTAPEPTEQPSGPTTTSPPPSAGETPTTPPVPDSESAALKALRTAELDGAGARRTELTRARSGQVARLLAALAAAGQTNAAYLGEGTSDD